MIWSKSASWAKFQWLRGMRDVWEVSELKLSLKKAQRALTVGEDVYIRLKGSVMPTTVRAMDALGITTDHDFYSWDEHGDLWWFTARGAAQNNPHPTTQT